MKIGKNTTPLRTALIYAFFGALWILLSDATLRLIAPDYDFFQTIKGWLFVLASASLIYLFLRNDMKSLRERQKYINYQAGLIKDVPDAIISTDMQFKVLSWNAAAEQMYGWADSETLGHPADEFINNEATHILREEMIKTTMEQGRWKGEIAQNHRDGSPFFISCSLSLVRDQDGRPSGFVTINRDITGRKQAENALRESEERFHKAFYSGPVGLAITRGSDGVYVDVNDAFSEIIGFSREELMRQTSLELNIITPEQRRNYIDLIREQGFIHNQEMVLRHKSGVPRVVLGSMEIIELNHETCVLSTAIDITERKQAEKLAHQQSGQIRLLYEASRQLNRTLDLDEIYQTICDFISIVAPNDGLFISAFDHETQLITCRAYWMDNKWLDVSSFPPIQLEEEGKGTQSIAIRTGQAMLINDYQTYLKTSTNVYYIDGETNEIDKEVPTDDEVTRSALIVPLKVGGMVTGVIQLTSYRQNAYTEDQLKLLEALSLHIASAEKNALLYAQVQNELNERKQAEEALRESNMNLARSQQIGKLGNWDWNIEGNSLNWSDEVYRIWGIGKDFHLTFETVAAMIHPHDRELNSKMVGEFLAHSNEGGFEFRIICPDGTIKYIYQSIEVTRASDNQPVRMFGIMQDITERKQAEELIRQYASDLEKRVEERTAELVRASRVKDEFLATMSHELRTPLSMILGYSESLLEGVYGSMDEKQYRPIEVMRSSGQHLLGLINDILDLSKIESGKFEIKPENIAVNDICQSSLVFIRQLANKKSITVEYSPSPFAPTIFADPKRLKQILVNLLNNAVKFTPEKGAVSLEVEEDVNAGQIRFSVTDTGIGIAPENLQKLFKPFVQLDSSLSRQYEGTGLGLSLVKKLVEIHGGSVGVESEAGKGSCFHFTIPTQPLSVPIMEDAKISAQLDQNEAKTKYKVDKRRILLVEDNEINMMFTSDYLNEKGYEVIEARDGLEAIAHVYKQKPDLILMDIQMPNMSGLEAIKHLRAAPEFASVPIIALTALAMPGDRELCLEAGATEYLAKPASLKTMVGMIESLLY